MSDLAELTDRFASRIMDASRVRDRAGLPAIMEAMEATGIALQILVQLLGRLPGLAMHEFLLANLNSVQRWTFDDYRMLLALACDHNEIAKYNLDWFLMEAGGLDHGTRATLWAGRYDNVAEHWHTIMFRGEEMLHLTDDCPSFAAGYRDLVSPEDLRAFQEDLRTKIAKGLAE